MDKCIIIDDPINPKQVQSDIEVEKVLNWYKKVSVTRKIGNVNITSILTLSKPNKE